MKWPCSGSSSTSGMVASGVGPVIEAADTAGASNTQQQQQQQQQRQQEDLAYFQRPGDVEFPSYVPKQSRWPLAPEDNIVDSTDKWKYTIPASKMTTENAAAAAAAAAMALGMGLNHTNQSHGAMPTYDLNATAALQQAVGVNMNNNVALSISNNVAAQQAAAAAVIKQQQMQLQLQQQVQQQQSQQQQANVQQQQQNLAAAAAMGALGAGNNNPEQLVYLPPHGLPLNMQLPPAVAQHFIQNCIPQQLQQQQQQQQQQQTQVAQQQQQQQLQMNPNAKKIWGLDPSSLKDVNGKGLMLPHLQPPDQAWRDSTWSTTDHAVSQPLAMMRRPGFPGGNNNGLDSSNILSPRGSDSTGGLGVKMVEYVLGSSPTSKDSLESRMRNLNLVEADKDKDKAPASPFDTKSSIKEENGVMQNGAGMSNGVQVLDDDKAFNRTPGSRQPSPGEEELTKNLQHSQAVMLKQEQDNLHAAVQAQQLHAFQTAAALNIHQHLQHAGLQLPNALADSVNEHFQHVLSVDQVQAGVNGPYEHIQYNQTPPQSQNEANAAAAAAVLQQQANFDVQQLFRSQQQSQAAAAAAAQTLSQPTAAQLQLLQQQQYLAAAAAQQAAGPPGAAFAQAAPFVLNQHGGTDGTGAATPYVPTLIAPGVPPYYGVAPWGVYPANIIQQNGNAQQRRPLSPNSQENAAAAAATSAALQGGYIVPYYDQNPMLVAQSAMRNGAAQMRLVSPAPVLVQQQPQAGRQAPGTGGLYSSATPTGLYGTNVNSSAVNGQTLSGVTQQSAAALFPALHAPPASVATSGPPTFANTSLGTLGSPTSSTPLQAGLGMNNSSDRRDSFDRNTSAFSPSLEYRQKWSSANAAAAAAVAANFGLGGSPSLTPPPSQAPSTSALQLSGLINSRVISAAPGAEGKYRAAVSGQTNSNAAVSQGLSNSTSMFGSTNSLIQLMAARPSLGAVTTAPGVVAGSLDRVPPGGRSRLLEDFRNNRFANLQLRELANHIVEFSQDQHGSRFIQQKLERATPAEKQLVFNEILGAAHLLMTDVFGNYVIQKFFEFGTAEQKAALAQKLKGHVLSLALQMYGCRVIQKALESIPTELQQEIVRELDGHVLKCVKDQNGNHVVQKCIESVDPTALQFIIKSFIGQVFTLSTHPYGCRVIQRVLEHCTCEQTAPLLAELHANTEQLIQDQFGNYVIQHVLEHGKQEDKTKLISSVRGKVLVLSQHKYASNVVEKCVTHATRSERSMLIEEVCNFNENLLHVMMKDQYANYVVQKMIDIAEPNQRKILMHKIRPHLNSLRKYTYGKHIIAKLEKFFMKTASAMSAIGGAGGAGNDLGPIAPPNGANAVM